jgi:hypothetical protein
LADVPGGTFPALFDGSSKDRSRSASCASPTLQAAATALSRASRICPEPNLLNSYLLSWNRPIYGGALLGVETGLDPGNRFHEIEIQTESVGSALDLLDRRSDRCP